MIWIKDYFDVRLGFRLRTYKFIKAADKYMKVLHRQDAELINNTMCSLKIYS